MTASKEPLRIDTDAARELQQNGMEDGNKAEGSGPGRVSSTSGSKRRRIELPPSPPWKSAAAQTPSSFIDPDGRKRSARTNGLPPPPPNPNARQTRSAIARRESFAKSPKSKHPARSNVLDTSSTRRTQSQASPQNSSSYSRRPSAPRPSLRSPRTTQTSPPSSSRTTRRTSGAIPSSNSARLNGSSPRHGIKRLSQSSKQPAPKRSRIGTSNKSKSLPTRTRQRESQRRRVSRRRSVHNSSAEENEEEDEDEDEDEDDNSEIEDAEDDDDMNSGDEGEDGDDDDEEEEDESESEDDDEDEDDDDEADEEEEGDADQEDEDKVKGESENNVIGGENINRRSHRRRISLRITFSRNVKPPLACNINNLPGPRKFESVLDYLKSEEPTAEDIEAMDVAAQLEAEKRNRIEDEYQYGILQPQNSTFFMPRAHEGPEKLWPQWAHADHLLTQAIRFNKLLKKERGFHLANAKKVAIAAAEVARMRMPKSQEQIELEMREESIKKYKSLVLSFKAKMKMAEKAVQELRLQRFIEAEKAAGRETLKQMLQHSSQLLGARIKTRDIQLVSAADDLTDTPVDQDEADDENDPEELSDSENESNMSDSQGSASDSEVDDGGYDDELTLEELKQKYANIDVEESISDPMAIDDHEVDGTDVHINTNGLNESAKASGSDISAQKAHDDFDSDEDITMDSENSGSVMADDVESSDYDDDGDSWEEREDDEDDEDDDDDDSDAGGLLGFFSHADLEKMRNRADSEGGGANYAALGADTPNTSLWEDNMNDVDRRNGESGDINDEEEEEDDDEGDDENNEGIESYTQSKRTDVIMMETGRNDYDEDEGEPSEVEIVPVPGRDAEKSDIAPAPDGNAEVSNGADTLEAGHAMPSKEHKAASPELLDENAPSNDSSPQKTGGISGASSVTTPTSSGIDICVKDAPKTAISPLLRGTLREYQHHGLDWLAGLYENKTNGILADEMGLGKTIQTIALVSHLATSKEVWGPHLIVVPTSVILNWEMEFKKWAPGFKILTYYGSKEVRQEKRRGWLNNDAWNVCITSYQLVVQDAATFKRRSWHYLILDEAHNIKNFRSQRWQTLLNFKAHSRLLITGTPLQNDLKELWSLLYFLMPSGRSSAMPAGFTDLKEFQEWFAHPVDQLIEGGREGMDEEARQSIQKLHGILRPFLLRRLKKDVEKQMPDKYEHIVWCHLSKRQRFLYEEFMGRAQTKETLKSGNYLSIINCLMQLRKVCNHPDLFETRQIVTSFAMNRSVVADFEIQELFIRRKMLSEGVFSKVDLDFLNLSLTSGETEGSAILSNVICHLRSSSGIEEEIALQTEKVSVEVHPDFTSSSAMNSFSAYKDDLYRLEHLKHVKYINDIRTSRRPILGTEIREVCSKMITPSPIQSIPSRRGDLLAWCWQKSAALDSIVSTLAQRSEAMDTLVQKFGCVTPAAVATDMSRLALLPDRQGRITEIRNMANLEDPFHRARNRLSIAFPDKRLLQFDCGKLQKLDELLRHLQAGGHRALIFTQMTKVLDILEQFLNIHGHRYLRLDGATKIEDRQLLTERFNNDNRILVFILSTRSGGLGINLTGADSVIFYDLDWNPAMDKQCQDRCHRIGQTRDVHIYRFVTEFTIEANILRKSTQKQMLDDIVIQEGEFTVDKFNRLTIADLFGEEARKLGLDSVGGNLIGPGGDMGRVLEQVEDADDVAAAKVAQKDDVDYLDKEDFGKDEALSNNTQNNKAETSTPTPAASMSGTRTGTPVAPAGSAADTPQEQEEEAEDEEVPSVDDYLLRFWEWELKDSPVLLPSKKKKSKKARAP